MKVVILLLLASACWADTPPVYKTAAPAVALPKPDIIIAPPARHKLPKPAAVVRTIDTGWWSRAHWTAAAFDYSTTGMWVENCHGCTEGDPVARFVAGTRPSSAILALGWLGESAAVSKIPNVRLRRTVQVLAIAAHVWAGAGNLRNLRKYTK